jgi:hypothetical protein
MKGMPEAPEGGTAEHEKDLVRLQCGARFGDEYVNFLAGVAIRHAGRASPYVF